MERSSTWAQGEEEQGLDSDITLEQFVRAFSDPYIMTTKADMMARFFNSAGSVNRGKVS